MNKNDKALKACIYNTDSVRILEILKKINFTGKCRIKTDNITIILTEEEGICQGAEIETEGDELSCQFTGLKDISLIKKITEINPRCEEIRLYTQDNKENRIYSNNRHTEITEKNEITEEKFKNSKFPGEKLSDGTDSLFEDELSSLDSASIIKMKEKLRREMENLASEILNDK